MIHTTPQLIAVRKRQRRQALGFWTLSLGYIAFWAWVFVGDGCSLRQAVGVAILAFAPVLLVAGWVNPFLVFGSVFRPLIGRILSLVAAGVVLIAGSVLSDWRFVAKFLAMIWAFLLPACTTAWKVESVQFQPVQTQLSIETVPETFVFINHRNVGQTPLEVPLDYEKEVRLERRRVSYWRTQPGLSLLLSVTSLGLYLPFSLIPIDTESRLIETGGFRGNEFAVVFRDGLGDVLGQDTLIARGEPELKLIKRLGGNEP